MNGRGSEKIIKLPEDRVRRKSRSGKIKIFLIALLFLIGIIAFKIVQIHKENSKEKQKNEISQRFEGGDESNPKLKDRDKRRRRITLVDGKIIEEELIEEKENKENKLKVDSEARIEEKENIENKKEKEKETGTETKTKTEIGNSTYIPPNGVKVVYLTFDDGPSYNTPKVLDILKKYNVKATFFVTCSGEDEMIKRAYSEGHTIGLHTCTHNYAEVYKNEKAFFDDLAKIEERVKRITGEKMKLIRLPGGSSNTISKIYNKGIMSRLVEQVKMRGYRYVDWNVSSGDAGSTINTNVVYNNVVSSLRGDYSIVLQHDGKGKDFSVNAVEKIIQFGKQYGFTFQKLGINSPTAPHRIYN